MHVHLRRSGAVALLAAAAALVGASCAENDSSIFIRGCMQVTRADCTVQVSTTATLQLEGTIDAVYAGQYICTALVENQMVPEGNQTTLMTETNGVELYDAEVQVLDPSQGMAALNQFSVPITGYVDPGMTGLAGTGATEIVLVDAATIQKEAAKVASKGTVQTVVASVVVRGRTLGGQEVHTQEFLYPILISAGGTCVEPSSGGCVGGTATTSTADCRLGIDEPAGTSCALIASDIGVCNKLECTVTAGKSDLTSAHCPAHSPPDNSCCMP